MLKRDPVKDAMLIGGILSLLFSTVALATVDETLTVWIPRASGTTPYAGQPTAPASSFWLYAYQGVEYRAYAVATGGSPPYTWTLSGQPSGMTVDYTTGAAGKTGTNTQFFTGLIAWPNPQASSGTITVTVTDANAQQASTTWTVTVQNSKFVFLDCDDAPVGNDGSLGNPYASISEMYNARPAHVEKIVMFRQCASTYHVYEMALDTSERKDFHGLYDPMQWIAYPGENATFDVNFQAGVTNGAFVRFTAAGAPIAWVGIDCINSRNQCTNIVGGSVLALVADSAYSDQTGTDGENPGFIMTTSGAKNLTMIVRNDFSDYADKGQANVSGSCIEVYAETYFVLIDNVCRDSVGSDPDTSGFHLKGGNMDQFFVMNNLVKGVYHRGIGGSTFILNNAIISFNRLYNCGFSCLYLNEFGAIVTPVDFRRNTVVGQFGIEDVGAGDGPFTLTNNVHVSSDPLGGCKTGHRVTCPNVTDASRVILSASPNDDASYVPADGCVDAVGLLIGPCAQYIGIKGAQVAASAPFTGIPGARTMRFRR